MDGDADLISNGSSKVAWYENGGNGEFLCQKVIYFDTGNGLVKAADLDGDGDPDIIYASLSESELVWFENNGSGIFGSKQVVDPGLSEISSLYMEDIDADGDMDVLVTSANNNRVVWYENFDSGQFSSPNVLSNAVIGARSAAAADLDNDGDIDVVASSHTDGRVVWFRNEGEEEFSGKILIDDTYNAIGTVSVADIDGDNDLDIIASTLQFDKIIWFENDGSGNFGPESVIKDDNSRSEDIFLTDMDDDGDIDVLSAECCDIGVAWYPNDGQGHFEDKRIVSDSYTGPSSLVSCDIDSDGDMDIAAASKLKDAVVWFKNLGDDQFSGQKPVSSKAVQLFGLATADLDGDGDMDVITGSYPADKISWFINEGDNNFSTDKLIDKTDQLGDLVSIDIDSDGDIDIISASSIGIHLYSSEGSGNFEKVFVANLTSAWSIDICDLDGDNDLDILAGNFYNRVIWIENLGNADFGTQQLIDDTSIGSNDLNFFKVHAADVDGDGDSDVLTCSYNEDRVRWYENDGTGQFSLAKEVSYSVNGPSDIVAADIDGDGDEDVLCAARLQSSLLLFKNDGQENFGNGILIGEGGLLRDIDVADLDEDGDIDIIANSGPQNSLCWHENDGTGQFLSQNVPGAGRPYQQSISDMDGDGFLDIVHAGSGLSGSLWWSENKKLSLDCGVFDTAPRDLNKAYPLNNGSQDRVALKFYKDSPQIKYSDEDAAACDIKAWELRNLDPETGLVIGNIIQNPDTILLADRTKSYQDGQPKSIFKWPLKYFMDGANNEARVRPNKRYQWQVRCACEHGAGIESPWSTIKFFDTPDFDTMTGTLQSLPPIANGEDNDKSIAIPLEAEKLIVSPNPGHGIFTISYPTGRSGKDVKELYLLDPLGRVITSGVTMTSSEELIQVDMRSLKAGAYYIRVVFDNNSYSSQVMKL